MFREALASRDIEELPQHLVTGIDPSQRVGPARVGETLPYDLFVGIPIHRAPERAAGIRARRRQLGARGPDEPQDGVPRRLRARRRLHGPSERPQGRDLRRVRRASGRRGHRGTDQGRRAARRATRASGVCYAEFGAGLVGKVEVNFLSGDAPRPNATNPHRIPRKRNSVRSAGLADSGVLFKRESHTLGLPLKLNVLLWLVAWQGWPRVVANWSLCWGRWWTRVRSGSGG